MVNQGTERALVNFVTNAVTGARQTLGLRFALPETKSFRVRERHGIRRRASFRLQTRGPVKFKLSSGRGHYIPAPTWEGCRATLKILLSCSAVPPGGCRSSGWALVLLAGVSRWLVGFRLFSFPFARASTRGRSEGVGIKEGTRAGQSALLHGPELFLRRGCRSKSSCDGIRPTVI